MASTSRSALSIIVHGAEGATLTSIASRLRERGHHVRVALSPELALLALQDEPADVVLIVGLGAAAVGRTVPQLSAASRTAATLVVGPETSLARRKALDAGADACVSGSVDGPELEAWCRALRRGRSASGRDVAALRAGPLAIQGGRRGVTVSGRPVALPVRMYEVLYELVLHRGSVVSRERLANDLTFVALESLVSRLRQRIHPVQIQAQRHRGYMLVLPPPARKSKRADR